MCRFVTSLGPASRVVEVDPQHGAWIGLDQYRPVAFLIRRPRPHEALELDSVRTDPTCPRAHDQMGRADRAARIRRAFLRIERYIGCLDERGLQCLLWQHRSVLRFG